MKPSSPWPVRTVILSITHSTLNTQPAVCATGPEEHGRLSRIHTFQRVSVDAAGLLSTEKDTTCMADCPYSIEKNADVLIPGLDMSQGPLKSLSTSELYAAITVSFQLVLVPPANSRLRRVSRLIM